ncbi:hypothetical protein HUI95_20240 [Aeromonas dhakensis]|uniref:hypothetical protein n=1 Tax=Aeromonas dhakensis TaxID=196024 RepID=UPI001A8DD074|nr:hypothetical protein [Aeromonas dhakensis]QSR45205.1 hypothetical protein HUI95_20240 [Aeromonas dhakensis]
MSNKIEHGKHSVVLKKHRLIMCELIGTFNKEGMESWILKMRSTIEPIKKQPFCLLVDLRHYAGATEEALEAADIFHQWLKDSFIVCQAHVISSQTLYSISLSRLPSLKYHVVKSFLKIDEALAWVAERLNKQINNM